MPKSRAMKSSACGASSTRRSDSSRGLSCAKLPRAASRRAYKPSFASRRKLRKAVSTRCNPSRSYRSANVMPKPSVMEVELSAKSAAFHTELPYSSAELSMQIKNSVFLVTGGASGLGAASARMAAEGGGKVVIADLQVDAGEKLAKELGGRFVKTDVSSEADGKAAVATALKEFGGLHVLVNCAGIALAERTIGKEAPHDLGRFVKVITVNVVGTFNMIRLAADAMAKAGPN